MEHKQAKARTVLLQWFAPTGEFLAQGNYTSIVETMPLVCDQLRMLANHGKRFGLPNANWDDHLDNYVLVIVLDGVNARLESEPFKPTLPPDPNFEPFLYHLVIVVSGL